MSHLLKEKDIVHCESQEQYDRIIELSKKAGIPLHSEAELSGPRDGYSNLNLHDDAIYANRTMRGDTRYQWHTEAEFVAKMFGIGPKDAPIRVKDWTVEFHDDGSIVVGCTRVENATLNAICERANKAKNK